MTMMLHRFQVDKAGKLLQRKDAWGIVKRKEQHWIGRKYVSRDLVAKEDEIVIQEAMKQRGVSGGCWNLIMHGRPPRQTEAGFRELEGCASTCALSLSCVPL